MIQKQIGKFAIAGLLASVAGVASATDCASQLSSYNACSTDSCRQNLINSTPQCFVGSNASTASTNISATTVLFASTISNQVGTRLLSSTPSSARADLGQTTGMAAGNGAQKFNVWGNITNTHTAYNGNNNLGNADKSSGNVLNSVVGLDYGFAPNMIAGFSVSYDRGHGSTGNNATGTSTKGLNYAPYFGWQLAKNLALDVSAGWGDGEFTSPQGSTTIDSRRSFYGANLNFSDWMGNYQVAGKVGYLDATEKYDNTKNGGVVRDGTSSKNKLGRLSLGGEVGYWMNGVMPFAGLAYTSDSRSMTSAAGFKDTSTLGKDAFLVSLGVNFFNLGKGVTGGLLYTQETGRSNGKNNSIGANLGLRF